MKCPRCHNSISILTEKCPICLFQINAEDLIRRKTEEQLSRQFNNLEKNFSARFEKINIQHENRIKRLQDKVIHLLSTKYLPEKEIEVLFDSEIIPAIDNFYEEAGDKSPTVQGIEEEIISGLGITAYNHYKEKGEDVLRIIRAGELSLKYFKDIPSIDLSVIMFPFFKAAEKSCWMHTNTRYDLLSVHSLVGEIDSWLSTDPKNINVQNVPGWLKDRTKTLVEVVQGLQNKREFFVTGCLRTGIALYIFGRSWIMAIYRNDVSKTKKFLIENILNASGSDNLKQSLAFDLYQLQKVRNERVHKEIETNEQYVLMSKTLSYRCMKNINLILSI